MAPTQSTTAPSKKGTRLPGAGEAADVAQTESVGSRVSLRRTELGLSLEELSKSAGIDPTYLRYFESNPNATLSAGTLLLVALALDISPRDLQGGEIDRPPGNGRAGRHPVLETLTPEQCGVHLAAGGVGRVIFSTPRGPVALPVNFEFTKGEVVFSTNGTKALVLQSEEVVGFEVDRVDEAMCEGWSVLATGPARHIDDPDEVENLASLDLETWSGGTRHTLIGIRPDELTGRVIVHHSNPNHD
jgi:nitroimidazol reductase NimA-like FMN-containing flavoprotein (pyridoxamine 5'-phosphate oxidase superfamily)